MEQVTKIYELGRKYSAYYETRYCGVVVPLSFTSGAGSSGVVKSELVVTDKFTQDAIESDPRFGVEFFLTCIIDSEGNETQPPAPAPKAPVRRRTRKEIEAEREAKNAAVNPVQESQEAPQLSAEEEAARKRSEASRKAAATRKAKKAAEDAAAQVEAEAEVRQEPVKKQEPELEFANVNDALTYFLGKGIAVTPDALPGILEQHRAIIKD